jgi:phosphoserine / homoserine phosphotransferase
MGCRRNAQKNTPTAGLYIIKNELLILGGIIMNIVCLDMEGVLIPEIWIAFAEATGIEELKRTTRDEPDYDKLMQYRLDILKQHGLGINEIQETISKMDPIPGAKEFLDELRTLTQVIIISDTFEQFAQPMMAKLGWPTLFCNSLEIAESGEITNYKMRVEKSKYTTVKALQSIGFDTIASGDSHNDIGMIQASKAGFLFKSTDSIKAEYPDIPAYDEYDDLLAAIKEVL